MLLQNLKQQSGVVYGAPAKDDELESCLQALLENDFPLPPDSYVALLKQANGLAWNGMELFGAKTLLAEGYELKDILTANRAAEDSSTHFIGKLVVGKMDNDIFAYDYDSKAYQVIDRTDGDVAESFATPEDLLSSVSQIS